MTAEYQLDNEFIKADTEKVANEAGFALFGSLLGKGLFFLSQVIIARCLGLESFGLYALGFTLVKICEIFARLGLNNGGMRFVSIHKDSNPAKLKSTVISATGISLLNGILIGTILYFLSANISTVIFHKPALKEPLQLFALGIPFIASTAVVSSLLRGFHTMKYTVYMQDVIQPLANIILIICFYLAGFELPGVISAFILSHLAALIIGIFYLDKLFPNLKGRSIKADYEIRELILYSIPLLFVGFLHYLLLWTGTLMLGLLGSVRDVGIYRAASQLPSLMTIFLVATNSIYAPLAANLYQNGQMQRLSSIFKTTTRWVTYITIPIFIFLVFSSKEVMMIFGKQYVENGFIVLIILSFGQMVNCITGGAGFTLTMTEKQKLELINSIGLVFLNIVFNLWLIPKYAVMGAAIATSISVVIINTVRLLEIYFLYRVIPYSRGMAKILVPAFVCVFALFFLQLDFSPVAMVSINIFLIVGIFGLLLYTMGIADEDKYLIHLFKSKISL